MVLGLFYGWLFLVVAFEGALFRRCSGRKQAIGVNTWWLFHQKFTIFLELDKTYGINTGMINWHSLSKRSLSLLTLTGLYALSLSVGAESLDDFKASKQYQEYLEFQEFKKSKQYRIYKRESVASKAALDEKTAALFDLDLNQLMSMEVTIASKTPESIRKAAGTVYVITEEEIHRYGWRDLREILESTPALSTRRSFDWFSVSLRGGGANMVKLLIDGREVQNLIADEAVIQESFPAHRIKRVEVLMGSHSTLYGSNAADGVINVITKHGSDEQEDETQLQVTRGEVNTSQVSVVMRNNFEGGGHFGLSASTFESDYNWSETTDFTQNNELWSRRDSDALPDYSNPVSAPYRSYSIGFLTEFDGHYLGANIWQDTGPQGYGEVFSYWGERKSVRKFDQWFVGTDYQMGAIEGTAEYIYTVEEDFFLEPDWNGSLEPTRHHIKTEASTKLDKHQLVFGYDGYRQKTIFRNDAIPDGGDGLIRLYPGSQVKQVDTTKHSLFVHDSYEVSANRLQAILGMRYDAYKDVDGAATFKTGLIYTPNNQSSYRLIYGGGFRAPNGFDVVRAENAGNSSLEPIKSDMVEFGYVQSLTGDDWLLFNNFSVYEYDIDGNYISRLVDQAGSDTGLFIIEPDDSSSVFGAENMLKFEYSQFSGFLSARYSKPDKTEVAGELVLNNIPEFKLKLGLSYAFSEHFTASLFVDHWDDVKTEANLIDVEGSEVIDIADWTTLDMNLVFGKYRWGPSDLTVTLHGENMTGETYYHSLGASPVQMIQPPRNFRVTADLTF